jgi:arginase family enzyme
MRDSTYRIFSKNINKIELPVEFPEIVFLKMCVDGFDPAMFPSPTAVTGFLGWWQALSLIEAISK